jgi:hypothetical protein
MWPTVRRWLGWVLLAYCVVYGGGLCAAWVFSPTLLFAYGEALVLPAVISAVAMGCSLALLRKPEFPPGYCRECGYDLTGNVSGVCPECGTPIHHRF